MNQTPMNQTPMSAMPARKVMSLGEAIFIVFKINKARSFKPYELTYINE